MPERSEMFRALQCKILEQIEKTKANEVELLSNDRMDVSTGQKRNMLIDSSSGDFVVFVDDDDDVYDCYIEEILKTITENPNVDCIGINGLISFNGQNHKKWFISKKFERWYESAEVYYRTPNHISPIRRTIAKLVPFPNIHHGEDFAYSIGILPHLHNEATIEKPLYHYQSKVAVANHPPNQDENGAPYRPAWR
jgi:glycosyltransferase involved in cell wall biosynthesis